MKGSVYITAGVLLWSLLTAGCHSTAPERKIEFVYLAIGASDVMGEGATPRTEGYVYLVNRDLQQRIPGTFLINLGVPGARIDALIEQIRLAEHVRSKADIATVWTGVNDLLDGETPSKFQTDLRQLLRTLQSSVSKTVVIANLPDLTKLSAFRSSTHPAVTLERVKTFNRAIELEARYINASIVDLFDEPIQDDLVLDGNGFHPNRAGHKWLEHLFLKVILERLGLEG